MTINSYKRDIKSGLINDPVLNDRYPNSNTILFKEKMYDGSIEYCLIIRTKVSNMATHRADVRIFPPDFGTITNEKIRDLLLDNIKEL